ncbi:hypothetical protein [Stieleria varia]|uniref:Uncharacterized protein n=1 Tax=Stieleria varia TaxID=2528005 RepID=A0A5C6AP89_9BACT|nr:hypothetical protein [Stieleria varia]TWU01327.1 hypothetical protein Pla52n_47010 [Stieleria varia]
MCCFAGPVKSVTDTNLFARLSGNGTQLLAYQMKFETEKENAMILPLPVATPAREDSLQFISLKEYDSLFDDMDRAFPVIKPPSRGYGVPLSAAASAIDSPLVVHDVGDFVASFVPTMNDFGRLDPRFVIPKSSWDKIPQYADYGFAVFQLKDLKGKPHPMAFEFETRMKNEIFFPTVHIHDGEVHRREHFDHTLYLQNAEFDKVVGKYVNHRVKDSATGFVRSKDIARRFCEVEKAAGLVDGNLLLHRIEMRGTMENKDVIAPVAAAHGKTPGFRFGHLLSITPALLGMCGLGWIINRRNRLRREG